MTDEQRPPTPPLPVAPTPPEDALKGVTFTFVSRVTTVVVVTCILLLIAPYAVMMTWLILDGNVESGCRLAIASDLFRVFCIHSVRFFGTAFGGIIGLSGSLFLLNKLSAPIKIEGQQSATARLMLETASPGLVMIVAGALLVVAGMYREVTFNNATWICVDRRARADEAPAPAPSTPDAGALTPGCSPATDDCSNVGTATDGGTE